MYFCNVTAFGRILIFLPRHSLLNVLERHKYLTCKGYMELI
nr:MAG TPA: hypothetical protein [Bacteriophage sp.]